MLVKKMLKFKLPAAHSVRFPAGEALGLARSVLLWRAAIFIHRENDSIQDSPRVGCPCWEGDVCEKPTSQLHTCMEGKVTEEIKNYLE